MAKPKADPTKQAQPVEKRTRQGQGRRSRPNHGRKQKRGQG